MKKTVFSENVFLENKCISNLFSHVSWKGEHFLMFGWSMKIIFIKYVFVCNRYEFDGDKNS